MKRFRKLLCRTMILLTGILCTAQMGWAKPRMEVTVVSTKEIVEIVKGEKVKKTVPADIARSGDVITFSISYFNRGDSVAVDTVIDNPISSGMSYIDNSATRVGDVMFSIDGGKSFKKPSLLTYEIKLPGGATEHYTARPEEYTHIRWVVKPVPAASEGTVSFKARVK